MKNLFIIFISLICLISCGTVTDPALNCNSFKLTILMKDAAQRNIVSDSVFSFIKYDKDSIKYKVESEFDTTDILTPIFTGDLFYAININYKFNNNFSIYNIIYILNSTERDTISINIKHGYTIEYYYKNALIKKQDDGCGYLDYIIKK